MMNEETGLFEVKFTEQGKKFIRKFVAISYTIFVLVLFSTTVSIIWSITTLTHRIPMEANDSVSIYDAIYPYTSILFSLIALTSNFYYVRFPRVLLRCIELNDEFGANRAFGLLFRGAMIFLVWLILDTIFLIWNLTMR